MIKQFFKDITGITAIELDIARKEQEILEADARVVAKQEKERAALEVRSKAKQEKERQTTEARSIARKEKAAEKKRLKNEIETDKKASPKEIANKKQEPWVDVISFSVNTDNLRNGFYELDWNDLFILQLRQEGYGFDGDPDEEIVSRWFRDICINAAEADDIEMTERTSGHLDVSKLQDSGRD